MTGKMIKKQIQSIDIKRYAPISEFFKIIDDFSIIPDRELETIEIGIFDRKVIRGIRISNQLCLTLKQTANYINVVKKTIESVWDRHKKDLRADLDYLQFEGTYYLPLRGILKLLKWTHSGFSNRFYDSIVDYICDSFSPVNKSRYEQFRIFILDRDKNTCQVCGNLCNEVHHKFSQAFYPHLKYDPENAKCVCYDCHEAITKDGRKRFEK